MCRDLSRSRTVSIRVGQVRLNLLTTRAGGVEVLARVAADLGLAAATAFDFVAECGHSRRQLRPVHRRRVLLCAIELAWLQRTDGAVRRLCQIEDDCVGVKLRGRVAVDWPRAVVFKERGDRIACCFRTSIAAEPRLHVRLKLLQRDTHALTVRLTNALVAANQRSQ